MRGVLRRLVKSRFKPRQPTRGWANQSKIILQHLFRHFFRFSFAISRGPFIEAGFAQSWCLRLLHLTLFLRFSVASVLLGAGIRWLARTTSITECMLNAVALNAILDVDEFLFAAFTPVAIQLAVQNLEPIKVKYTARRSQIESLVLCLLLSMTIITSYFNLLRPLADTMVACLCSATSFRVSYYVTFCKAVRPDASRQSGFRRFQRVGVLLSRFGLLFELLHFWPGGCEAGVLLWEPDLRGVSEPQQRPGGRHGHGGRKDGATFSGGAGSGVPQVFGCVGAPLPHLLCSTRSLEMGNRHCFLCMGLGHGGISMLKQGANLLKGGTNCDGIWRSLCPKLAFKDCQFAGFSHDPKGRLFILGALFFELFVLLPCVCIAKGSSGKVVAFCTAPA